MMSKPSNEQLYFDILTRIAKDYASPAQLRKSGELRGGLDYEEALEMAYENIQLEAKSAIKGKRRPA
jgi:hypothetical protein